MTERATRWLAAICGITGVLMLTAHFLIPDNIPSDSASLAQIATFVRGHRDVILISAWLQVTGAILCVVFILAIVHLAGAGQRFAGRIVATAAAILVGLTLLDSAMIISTVKSAAQGHSETLRVSFDLMVGPGNDAVGRSFLIAPAILLPLGFVILQTRLLPRSYGWIALAFGAADPRVARAVQQGRVRGRQPSRLGAREPLADHRRGDAAGQSALRAATRHRYRSGPERRVLQGPVDE
jgi:hypothetical protein